jgi:hypothetical protein
MNNKWHDPNKTRPAQKQGVLPGNIFACGSVLHAENLQLCFPVRADLLFIPNNNNYLVLFSQHIFLI